MLFIILNTQVFKALLPQRGQTCMTPKKKKAFFEAEWAVGWAGRGDLPSSPNTAWGPSANPGADAHLQRLFRHAAVGGDAARDDARP